MPEPIASTSTGATIQRRPHDPIPPDRLAEEVGLLSLRGSGSYIGSMSGVTLGSLVASAIGLYGQEIAADDEPNPVRTRSRIRAGYPPKDIAVTYVEAYLSLVHRWYPFINLDQLGRDLISIYNNHEAIDDYGKFVLFMIFGIVAMSAPASEPFTSEMYFNAASSFLDGLFSVTSVDTVRVMLLLCIFRLRAWKDDSALAINAWRTVGLAVRIALELGLTRNNHRWAFEEEENEARRWVWWSLYSVERCVAIGTGRVLSIRNEAIDAHYPHATHVHRPPSLTGFLGNKGEPLDVRPAIHLLPQRKLLGDIMECVYITRPQDRPSVSIEATTNRVYQLQADLITWETEALKLASLGPTERDVLQLCFHQATMLLHRPSPSFPCPPPEALDVCMGAARGALRIAAAAVRDKSVEQVMPGWAGFSSVFLSGLTLMYCSWASFDSANAIRIGKDGPAGDPDIQASLTVLQSLASIHKVCERYLSIYQQLVTAFAHMLAPPLIGNQSPPNIFTHANPLARAAEEIGLATTQGLELDQAAMEFIQSLIAGGEDVFTELP